MLKLIIPLMAVASAPAAETPPAQDPAERRAVLRAVADLIRDRYVGADRAPRIAAAVREDARIDRFADASSDEDFAAKVTARLRTLTGDGHFALEKRAAAKRDGTGDEAELKRWYGAHVNHGF